MLEITENIFRSEIETPFGNSVCTSAYFITRSRGNLLFYSSSEINKHLDFMKKMGGVSSQYINHRDEASSSCDLILQRFQAPLFCHPFEVDAVKKVCEVGGVLTSNQIADDLQFIHTPGHCPGSTCFLLKSKIGGILFTGDTLFPNRGKWCVAIQDGQQATMIDSLKKLINLDVKMIIPSLFIGDVSLERFDDMSIYQTMLLKCIERLKSGETH